MKRNFVIVSRDLSQKIQYSQILYIAQDLRDICIVTGKETIWTRGRIADLLGNLPDTFFPCHAYRVVNFERISKMTDGTVFFDNGKKLTIGRNNYIRLRKKYNSYLLSLA